MKNNNYSLYTVYRDNTDTSNKNAWATYMNSVIDHLGFRYIRDNFYLNNDYWSQSKLESKTSLFKIGIVKSVLCLNLVPIVNLRENLNLKNT